MKRHLTNASIQRLKPPATGQVEVFDLGYPGLALRISHGGAKTFEVFYRINGKLRRQTIGRWPAVSLADAHESWRKTREALAKGSDPANPGKAPAMLFEHVVEEWLRRDQSKNKSVYQVTRALEADLLPAWRDRRVDEIGKRDVIELLDAIADRGSPIMARKVQAYIRRFFTWCIERDILKVDPTCGMSRVGHVVSRDRVLTDAELVKVWKSAEGIGLFGSAVRMLILSGARREEITKLRWSEIDGDCIKLEGARTKNGAPHIIPLSSAAWALLRDLPRIANSDFVFTTSGTKPISGWSKPKMDLDARSGVTGWRIHDLRRTVATGMQKLSVSLQVTEAVLGHTSGSRGGIVGVYQRHDYAKEKAAALDAWARHVVGLVS